jgi:hypothetical protein
MILIAPVQVVRRGHGIIAAVQYDDEPFGIAVGQRAKQNGVHDAKDGGVGADAKGERENGGKTEAGVLSEHAAGVTEVLHPSGEEGAYTGVANLFLHIFHSVHFEDCLATGLFWGTAVRNFFVGEKTGKGAQFFVEVSVDTLLRKHVATPVGEFRKQRHEGS